jgi:predicted nucleic acid-binding protein
VEEFCRQNTGRLHVSHWVRSEFVSVLGRAVRTKTVTEGDAAAHLEAFDRLLGTGFQLVDIPQAAILKAADLMLPFGSPAPLRAPDALHIAISRAHGLTVVTADAAIARFDADGIYLDPDG